MFQRFKDASSLVGNFVDQLADEQNRLRAQQAQPSSGNTRRPAIKSRSTAPAGPKGQRGRPNDVAEGASLVGPDPDPVTFDTATIEEERAEPNQDDTPEIANAAPEDVAPVEVAEKGDRDVAADPPVEETPILPRASSEVIEEVSKELPTDVQAKLRKLGKIETKYQELLKAYRRAHARNSLIEPFEACLRENTPLTSIVDPTALAEYLNQVNTKGDMVMTELKSVSSERDVLKRKLEEAKQETKAAYDEMTQLRQQSTKPETSDASIDESSGITATEEHDANSSAHVSEVPRLQLELQHRTEQVTKLEIDNADLQRDLGVAKEAAEHIMHDMESARKELELMHTSHEEARTARDQRCFELEATVTDLKARLDSSTSHSELLKSTQESSVLELQRKLNVSQHELEALHVSQTRTDSEYAKKVEVLDGIVTELRSQLKSAETDIAAYKADVQKHDQPRQPTLSETTDLLPGTQDDAQMDDVQQEPDGTASKSKKKKNKKKKKGTGSTLIAAEPVSVNGDRATNLGQPITTLAEPSKSETNAEDYIAQLQLKDSVIDQLQRRMKEQEDLLEEIESLRDELITVGQEHVEAKDQLVQLGNIRKTLESRVEALELEIGELRQTSIATSQSTEQLAALQGELESARSTTDRLREEGARLEVKVQSLVQELEDRERQQTSSKASSEEVQKKLEADFADLRIKSRSLQTDLSAAESLAATRYKEMANLRDILQKAQPELTSLRTEVVGLRAARDELAVKSKELRRLELREDGLRSEMDALKVDLSAKEGDIKTLTQRMSQEASQRLSSEEASRKSQRDMARLQTERADAMSARENLTKELEQATRQLTEAQGRVQQLERQSEKLSSDTDSLRDEISLKTAQHASAEMLMSSVRDQAAEMATQMKEARERCESLEEELTDAHRLMSERGREGETMRRLLGEVEGRAESRIKEMRERMELAIQERDRAEDDASSIGRRRARELEELKSKLREVERDLKYAIDDKGEAQRVEVELRRQKMEGDARIEQSMQELADVRKAMSELRDALDEGERQVREFEVERNDLRITRDDMEQRVEKLQKSNKTLTDDLRSARATRIRPTDSPAQSARSSLESSRPARLMSPTSPRIASSFSSMGGPAPSIDYVYLKNVLLQFLEQKDKKHQMQLIPVLSMLLHFDRKDEQKWISAISTQ